MKRTRNAKLNLLSLEDRLTPAVAVNLVGDTLNIVGQDNTNHTIFIFHKLGTTDVYVEDQYLGNAGGQALAYEASHSPFGSFSTPNDLSINVRMPDGKNSIVLTIDDGETLPGNLTMRLGKEGDDVQIQARDNVLRPTISGQVYIRSSEGADNFFIFDTIIEGKTTINGGIGGLRAQGAAFVGGSVLQASNSLFDNDVTVMNCATILDHNFDFNEINGDLRVVQANTTFAGNFKNLDGFEYPVGSAPTDAGKNFGFLLIDGNSTTGKINIVNGSVFFGGTTLADGIYINGEITGNVKVVGNGGDDTFAFGDARGPYFPTITGNLTVKGGAGNDALSIRADSLLDGNVVIDMGDGNNTYDLKHAFQITGTLNLKGGSGSDVVGTIGVGTLGGGIDGNVTMDLGNGANNVEFAFLGSGIDINYIGGTGVDNVTLNENYNIFHGVFGDGNDTFQYGPNAFLDTEFFGDFGAGTDTYIRNGIDDTQWQVQRFNVEQVFN